MRASAVVVRGRVGYGHVIMRQFTERSSRAAAPPPVASVLIVNWNTGDLLRRCVASVAAGLGSVPGEVIVVDNASMDGSADGIAAVAGVRLLRRSANGGFAAGTNEAARESGGRHLVVLNPDAECEPGSLEKLVRFLDDHPGTAAVGPRLMHTDGRQQRSAWRGYPGVRSAAIDALYLWKCLFLPAVRHSEISESSGEAAMEVDHILGACMVISRDSWQAIGPLDEGYFLFLEETDWCRRAKLAGYSIHWLPTATVLHHGQQSVHRAPEAAIPQYYRSYARFARRSGSGHLQICALKLVFVVGIILRLGLWSSRLVGGRHALARRMVGGYTRALVDLGTY